MIEEVNKLSSGPSTAVARLGASTTANGAGPEDVRQLQDDPVNQLTAVLGAHLRALSNIDGNAGRLEEQVRELEGRMSGEAANASRARR